MIALKRNIHWLSQQAKLLPDRTAVISNNTTFSFNDIFISVSAAAKELSSRGINKGDHAALISENNIDFITYFFALWMIGAVPIHVNHQLTKKEIEQQLNISGAKFLLVHRYLAAETVFSGITKQYIFPLPVSTTFNKSFSDFTFQSGNVAVIIFTSGSLGKPKAVQLTFDNLFNSAEGVESITRSTTDDSWLASLPFYHIGGLSIILRSVLSGTKIIIPHSLKTEDIFEAIITAKPSFISLVPTTLKRILEKNIVLPNEIKKIFIGGGPSDSKLILEAVQNKLPIVKVYGSTETSSMVAAIEAGELISKPESSGKAILQNKIFIDGAEHPGITGEIVIESNSIMKGYYNDNSETQLKLRDGRYYSGDVGYIDDEGFLFVQSRKDDAIISGGKNIDTFEVKKEIESHRFIKEVFVFGIKDNEWGELLTAAIVLNNNCTLDESELINYLRKRIAAYKIPKKIFFVTELPKTDLGKIKKNILLEQLKLC